MKLSIFTLALTTVSALSKGKPLVESTPCKHKAERAYSKGFNKGLGLGKAGRFEAYKIGHAIGKKEGEKACEQTSESRERRFWVSMIYLWLPISICEPQLRTEWKIYKIFILGYFGWLGSLVQRSSNSLELCILE